MLAKIILISPKNDYNYKPHDYYRFPIGIAYISSAIKIAGYEVHCIDCHRTNSLKDKLTNLTKVSKNVKFIIGIGGLSLQYKQINEVISEVRSIIPNAVIILGGAIVTTEPKAILSTIDADYGVIGEGEYSVVELIDSILHENDTTSIPGIAIKLRNTNSKSDVIITPRREIPNNIDILPFPDYDGFDLNGYFEYITPQLRQITGDPKKFRAIAISGARSCPYHCTFCYHYENHHYRQRSLENIFSEVDILINKYKVTFIRFHDEVFCTKNNIDRLFELCDQIKKDISTFQYR